MTDGKSTTGRTEQDAAQQAADAKIPVSVIAFGTDHGAITVDGKQIPVPPDTQALQQIARTTGGDFHTAATTEELTSCTPNSASKSATKPPNTTCPGPG